MKHTPLLSLTMLLFGIAIYTNACKKDNPEPEKSFRITSSVSYHNDVMTGKTALTYEDEKLKTMKGYSVNNGITTEDNRIDFEYSGDNSMLATSYTLDGGSWVAESKMEITLDGGHVTNVIQSDMADGSWVPQDKVSRFYDAGILTQILNLNYNGSQWQNITKQIFEYSSSLVSLVTTSNWIDNIWEPVYRNEITYDGTNYNTILGFMKQGSTWNQDAKYVYEYVNNAISKVSYSSVYNGEMTDIYSSTYSYDQDGNLIQEFTNIDFGGYSSSYKNVYEYESGKGNWTQVTEALYGSGWFYQSILPNPTKSLPALKEQPSEIMKILGSK